MIQPLSLLFGVFLIGSLSCHFALLPETILKVQVRLFLCAVKYKKVKRDIVALHVVLQYSKETGKSQSHCIS